MKTQIFHHAKKKKKNIIFNLQNKNKNKNNKNPLKETKILQDTEY
jgi:hypothetical protein